MSCPSCQKGEIFSSFTQRLMKSERHQKFKKSCCKGKKHFFYTMREIVIYTQVFFQIQVGDQGSFLFPLANQSADEEERSNSNHNNNNNKREIVMREMVEGRIRILENMGTKMIMMECLFSSPSRFTRDPPENSIFERKYGNPLRGCIFLFLFLWGKPVFCTADREKKMHNSIWQIGNISEGPPPPHPKKSRQNLQLGFFLVFSLPPQSYLGIAGRRLVNLEGMEGGKRGALTWVE